MIKNDKGEKCTPKQLAKLAMAHAVRYATPYDVPHDPGDLTEKEKKLAEEQMEKVRARLLKILGTEE